MRFDQIRACIKYHVVFRPDGQKSCLNCRRMDSLIQNNSGPYIIWRSFAIFSVLISTYAAFQLNSQYNYLGKSFEMCPRHVPLMNSKTILVDHESETTIGNETNL